MKPINLKVEVLGYGPRLRLDESRELTAEEVVAISSWMTYKSGSAREIALDAIEAIKEDVKKEAEKKGLTDEEVKKRIDELFNNKIKKSLINSAGRGHASLSTSAGIWCLFSGSSKFVDSMFSGAVFSSSLMPSGRRIPVSVENIVVPESINGLFTLKVYGDSSRENIRFYESIIKKGIKTEEAAKITQYGILGGGFMYLPLETIIAYKHEFEIEDKWTPKEGNDFIKQIEAQLKDIGMNTIYWARNFAPRNTYSYPNVFTNPNKNSFIKDLRNKNKHSKQPYVKEDFFDGSSNFMSEADELYELSTGIIKDPELIKKGWKELLLARKDLVKRYNGIVSFSSFSDISWRVWGEVKRHRTLEQSVESVYSAVDRAREFFNKYKDPIMKKKLNSPIIDEISTLFEIPESIRRDNELLEEWIYRLWSSVSAYEALITCDIPKSDAIAVIPRGLKLSIFKRFNLYNILDGYIPLRLCGTAEYEMKKVTELEAEQIKRNAPEEASRLIGAKCYAVGFCLEEKPCGKINNCVDFTYTKEFHEEIHSLRKEMIYSML